MEKEVLKVAVDDLEKRKIELIEKFEKTNNAILALQEICIHEFCTDGRVPNYRQCVYCGKEQKEFDEDKG